MSFISHQTFKICTHLTLVLISLLSACNTKQEPSQSQASNQLSRPTLIEVNKLSKDLLFIFKDEKGIEKTVMTLDSIPEKARNQVQVVDLKLSPSERSSRHFVQLFDLRKVNSVGLFPGKVIERNILEDALASAQTLPEQPAIIVYSTAWCGVCKKARAFLKEKGLAFIEKDIEKDKAAARELQEKCERARVPLGGVPVIDVGGALMRGFDPNRLMSMLKSK